jgi:hypothetical protein
MIIETILLVVGISGVVSYETTGKGLTDHAISAAKDKDCQLARGLKGEDICQPQGTVTVSAPPKETIPPVTPVNPPPKKVVVVSNSINDMEQVFAQRKAAR